MMEGSMSGVCNLADLVGRIIDVIKGIPVIDDFPNNPSFLSEVRVCYNFLNKMEKVVAVGQVGNEERLFSDLSSVTKTLLAAIRACGSSNPEMEKSLKESRAILETLKSYQVLHHDEMVA